MIPFTTENFDYSVRSRRAIYFIFAIFVLVPVFILWRIKSYGKENLPKHNSCVYVSNHLSHFDSFAIGFTLFPRQPMRFIADGKLFKNKYFSWIITQLNAYPMQKGTGKKAILDYSINIVNAGVPLLWYFEGQRHKNPDSQILNKGKIGTGVLALNVKAPIIPIYIEGTEKAMPVGKAFTYGKRPRSLLVKVNFGKEVYLDDLRKSPNSLENAKKALARIIDSVEKIKYKSNK